MSNVAAANRAGIPSVVIHCAMHTFRADTNDAWRMVQGVDSRRHTPSHRIAVKVLQPSHPVMIVAAQKCPGGMMEGMPIRRCPELYQTSV